MVEFPIHNEDTAPEGSKPVLAKAKAQFGLVPNLYGALAEAPAAAEAYASLSEIVGRTSFTPAERHVVWFAFNAENGCEYCMAAHTAIAHAEKIPEGVIEAARTGAAQADARLEALRRFALKVHRERGWVPEADMQGFLEAGFSKAQALEVIVIAAHKTLSNYVNHIVGTPLDEPFQRFAWKKTAGIAA